MRFTFVKLEFTKKINIENQNTIASILLISRRRNVDEKSQKIHSFELNCC